MICKSYDNLTVIEKTVFIGQLVHLVQSNELFFARAMQLVVKGAAEGLLDDITILPEPINAEA